MEALVQMTGYVGSEVDFRAVNVPFAHFRLASTPRIVRGTEWVDGETTWISVKAFRGLAEHVGTSVRKGDAVIVIGKLRTAVWTKDGVTNERLELEALTLGHDLRRGTANFTRSPRAVRPDENGSADDGPDASGEAALTELSRREPVAV